jgi:predicted nuclease with TOPRIM domain
MSHKDISKLFNIEIPPEVINPLNNDIVVSNQSKSSDQIINSEPVNTDLEEDYEKVRKNLSELIKQSKEVLDSMQSLAGETETARSYEVVSELIKTNFEANKQLIELHKQIKEIKKEKNNVVKNEQSSVTNNAIFVGNTTDLLKLIKDKKSKAPPQQDGQIEKK